MLWVAGCCAARSPFRLTPPPLWGFSPPNASRRGGRLRPVVCRAGRRQCAGNLPGRLKSGMPGPCSPPSSGSPRQLRRLGPSASGASAAAVAAPLACCRGSLPRPIGAGPGPSLRRRPVSPVRVRLRAHPRFRRWPLTAASARPLCGLGRLARPSRVCGLPAGEVGLALLRPHPSPGSPASGSPSPPLLAALVGCAPFRGLGLVPPSPGGKRAQAPAFERLRRRAREDGARPRPHPSPGGARLPPSSHGRCRSAGR